LVASIPSSIGFVPAAAGAVNDDVYAAAAGDFHDASERILFRDVDRLVGAELLRHLEAPRILGGAVMMMHEAPACFAAMRSRGPAARSLDEDC
jgi:hypothetical protein